MDTVVVLLCCIVALAGATATTAYADTYTAVQLNGYSATAVNNSGQVVFQDGYITGPNGAGITALGVLPGYSLSYAYGINNSGQAVGISYAGGTGAAHAFITGANGMGITDLTLVQNRI